jgi:hypothetical protein
MSVWKSDIGEAYGLDVRHDLTAENLVHGEPARTVLRAEFVRAEVEASLHIGARDTENRATRELAGDCAMQMAGDDPADLAVPGDDLAERRAASSLRPIASQAGTPVRIGGWCIATSVGRSGSATRASWSHASCAASSAPESSPGIVLSSTTSWSGPSATE